MSSQQIIEHIERWLPVYRKKKLDEISDHLEKAKNTTDPLMKEMHQRWINKQRGIAQACSAVLGEIKKTKNKFTKTSPVTAKPSCSSCANFFYFGTVLHEYDFGECRRYPPSAIDSCPEEDTENDRFPKTESDLWCGEWRANQHDRGAQ